jgi:hypothetical protein
MRQCVNASMRHTTFRGRLPLQIVRCAAEVFKIIGRLENIAFVHTHNASIEVCYIHSASRGMPFHVVSHVILFDISNPTMQNYRPRLPGNPLSINF